MLTAILALGWLKAIAFGMAALAILVTSILPLGEDLEDEDV